MVGKTLHDIFKELDSGILNDSDKLFYSVLLVPGYRSYFVGKDHNGHACLLVETFKQTSKAHNPIRLKTLEVQFDLLCKIKKSEETEREGTFTVIRCRSLEEKTTHYFLSVCEIVPRILGDKPLQGAVASAVNRLAAIFQKVQKSPTRSVNGLFGELFIIYQSRNPVRTLSAWRINNTARFDFVEGNNRLEVKATSGRVRIHTFSYDQCNPPPGSITFVASLFIERSPTGISLQSIIERIEKKIAPNFELIFKLHEVIAATLGNSLEESLSEVFDEKLSSSSLRFFNLREIPAIRTELPSGVSDVHFRSDLSSNKPIIRKTLASEDPFFLDLIPKSN